MSHIFAGIVGAAVMSVALGAVQFASGSSLTAAPMAGVASAPANQVNRTVKGDRTSAAIPTAPTRTISLNLSGLNDTSVLVRIPAKVAMTPAAAARQAEMGQTRRAMNFACEPVVSALTEVAKRLSPGRCVT